MAELITADSKTSVSLSATFDINGSTVVLNSGDIKQLAEGKVVFSLTEPTAVGTPKQFLTWLNEAIGTDVSLPDASSIPQGNLRNAYSAFTEGVIQVDTIVVNQPQNLYKFGISFNFKFNFFGPLSFDGIGILVEKKEAGGSNGG